MLRTLADDPDTYSARFSATEIGEKTQEVYFYYSCREVAFMLIDNAGYSAELADEEKFNDEVAMWFTESSHRVSPFARIKALTDGFMRMLPLMGSEGVEAALSIVVSNSFVINHDDYIEVYDGLDGVLIHDIKDINRQIPTANHNSEGERLLARFADACHGEKELHDYFEPFREHRTKRPQYENPANAAPKADVKQTSSGITIVSETRNEYFTERELNEFFALEDPDFKSEEEVVNSATGERMTVRKEEDMPAVEILESLVDPQAFLDHMVGLVQLKRAMAETVAYARFAKRARETFPGHNPLSLNLHTIITGNPGTGKTTMCRIYGSLLHQAGVLSRGHTVVASRGTFIGQQFGVEEKRMRQCLKLAQGGCLFIDEAGLLISSPHPHDPGRGAIQLLLQILAEEGNRDIAVVLALYANDKSLERLHALNPGIKSRFVNILTFPDYTLEELIEIARRKIKGYGFSITPGGWRKLRSIIGQIYLHRDRNFGNAREVMNLLQRSIVRHAVRCERQGAEGEALLRIIHSDIPELERAATSGRIGFR